MSSSRPTLSTQKKSRLEGKPSLLPKPQRTTDHGQSSERRSSANGGRSRSADAARATFSASRQSREASATKIPTNRRSRSNQGDTSNWFGQSSMTPLRLSQPCRPTVTPLRTPTKDGYDTWQNCLDRVLASVVTVRDQRPISNSTWQRNEFTRVSQVLSELTNGSVTLIRPLTITKFVEIISTIINSGIGETQLSNDNYVEKLPNLAKKLLYPAPVAKSWLKTVNTLHTFPQALALVSYFLDMLNYIERPMLDERLYLDQGDVGRLRREYFSKCWVRFQDLKSEHVFGDFRKEYLQELKELLGDDQENIAALYKAIENKEHELAHQHEEEESERNNYMLLVQRKNILQSTLSDLKTGKSKIRNVITEVKAKCVQSVEELRRLDQEIEQLILASKQLDEEIKSQPMTVQERTELLDKIDYEIRILNSKEALAQNLKMILVTKDGELALWQKKVMDCLMTYNQQLLHCSSELGDHAAFVIDENQLMDPECVDQAKKVLKELKAKAGQLIEEKATQARSQSANLRRRAHILAKAEARRLELKENLEHLRQNMKSVVKETAAKTEAWTNKEREINALKEMYSKSQEEYSVVEKTLDFWTEENKKWHQDATAVEANLSQLYMEADRLLKVNEDKLLKIITDRISQIRKKIKN